jgi:hypothetical protein
MPILLISGWNPISVSYFLIFLQLIVLLLLYFTLQKIYKKSHIAIYFSILYTFLPTMVDYSRFIWAPNLLIPVCGVVLSLLLFISRKANFALIFFLGFFLGIGLQIHYSFFLSIVISLFWLLLVKKLTLKGILLLSLGFIIGFSPLIIFELRHNFYNLQTFLFYLTTKTNSESAILKPSLHYVLGLLPFILFIIAFLLARLAKINRYLVDLPVFIFILLSLQKILPIPTSGFAMVEGWNYDGEKKAVDIILSENKVKYNLIDLLTGDTRAMAIRSLLTLAGKPPLGVVEYPDSQALFIYSKVPIEKLLAGHLWEIDVVRPARVTKSWYLQNGIYLFLVEKTPLSVK